MAVLPAVQRKLLVERTVRVGSIEMRCQLAMQHVVGGHEPDALQVSDVFRIARSRQD